jgi:hypothetical protein
MNMKNLISLAIAQVTSLINGLQFKRFFAVVLAGFILLTTNVDSQQSNQPLANQVREEAEIDSVRPKTTREWYKEARETENSPGKRLENIAEESAQAIKEFGSLYPDTAKRSAPDLQKNS